MTTAYLREPGLDFQSRWQSFPDLKIPAVFVTGSREDAFAARDMAVGYLCKPCDPGQVGAAVSAVEKIIAGETPGTDVLGFVVFAEGVNKFHQRVAGP